LKGCTEKKVKWQFALPCFNK